MVEFKAPEKTPHRIAALSAAGLDVRFMAYEICPDTLRVFRQHCEDYNTAVHDLCKLLGVD